MGIGAGIAIAAALGLAVNGEMLGGGDESGGGDGARGADADLGDVVGILAITLDHAAPARVAGEVHDGAINVAVAEGLGLAGDD